MVWLIVVLRFVRCYIADIRHWICNLLTGEVANRLRSIWIWLTQSFMFSREYDDPSLFANRWLIRPGWHCQADDHRRDWQSGSANLSGSKGRGCLYKGWTFSKRSVHIPKPWWICQWKWYCGTGFSVQRRSKIVTTVIMTIWRCHEVGLTWIRHDQKEKHPDTKQLWFWTWPLDLGAVSKDSMTWHGMLYVKGIHGNRLVGWCRFPFHTHHRGLVCALPSTGCSGLCGHSCSLGTGCGEDRELRKGKLMINYQYDEPDNHWSQTIQPLFTCQLWWCFKANWPQCIHSTVLRGKLLFQLDFEIQPVDNRKLVYVFLVKFLCVVLRSNAMIGTVFKPHNSTMYFLGVFLCALLHQRQRWLTSEDIFEHFRFRRSPLLHLTCSLHPGFKHLAVAVWEGKGIGDDDRWQWTTNTLTFSMRYRWSHYTAGNWSMHELRYGCFGVLSHRHVGSYQRCQQHSESVSVFLFLLSSFGIVFPWAVASNCFHLISRDVWFLPKSKSQQPKSV